MEMQQVEMQESDWSLLRQLIRERKTRALAKLLFNFNATPTQAEIIKEAAFSEHPRVNICAMTRFGKTKCWAVGKSMKILFSKNKRFAFIAPKREQAEILRNYMAELIVSCPPLLEIAQLDVRGAGRLTKEASKSRQTFANGCEYKVFSAHDEANALMGFGADDITNDEYALIKRKAGAKIRRMLGDNPKGATQANLFNPWDTDTLAYDDWMDPAFYNIHVPWQVAVKEGRVTQEFIDEMRKKMPPLEFTVLYESMFPTMSEDSIFDLSWIHAAMKRKLGLWSNVTKLREALNKAKKANQAAEVRLIEEELKQYKIIIACDPADKGLDFTVILAAVKFENQYEIFGWYYEATSDNMAIASKVWDFGTRYGATHLHIDGHGLGVGVISRLQQIKRSENNPVYVKACLFGGKATSRMANIYANQKAENYFKLRDIYKQGRISIPNEALPAEMEIAKRMSSELMKMKWEKDSSEKTRIVDPDKSPDFADAQVYVVFEDKGDVTVGAA